MKIYRQDDGYTVSFLIDGLGYRRGVKAGLPELGFEWIAGRPGVWLTDNEDKAWKLAEVFHAPIIMSPEPVR